jgi:DNA repair exonuclease SbcCD nuclease subunit
MRTLNWLQISDFHLRESQAWEQDVVLSEMCQDIERRGKDIGPIDFVLATGDLAFAGQPEEYKRAEAFFNEVIRVTSVPRERVYFIPGNHDVNRKLQKTCFAGARHILKSENEIDSFLEIKRKSRHYCRDKIIIISFKKPISPGRRGAGRRTGSATSPN